MIGSTWNVVLIAVAMGAGMFAQQAAHKVSATSEDNQVNSLVGLESYCSAEGYYLTGRFSPATAASPAASPIPSPLDDQPLLATAGSQADEPLPATADSGTAPPAMELAAAQMPPAAAPVEPTAANDAASAGDAPAQPQADVVVAAESHEPAAESPQATGPQLVDAAANPDASAEVLPPPAPDAVEGAGRDPFSNLAGQRATGTPRSSIRPPVPASIPAPAGSTYYDATASQGSRYATPADLVRERAIARGEQRHQRVETRKWLGISPLRPTVDSTPYSMVEQPAQLLLVAPDSPATIVR